MVFPRILKVDKRSAARHVLRVLFALLSGSIAHPAAAWGPQGHRIVALVAQSHLTPRAREQVEALLALEPGASLASVSTWADQVRGTGTARWHYVNLPRGCGFDAARDCPDGQCVVGAIEAQRRVLVSAAPSAERLQALKYLVHFVADVHQPLHAGHADDRGGNTFQIQLHGRGTNLHALWDSGLLRHLGSDPEAMARRLLDTPLPAQATTVMAPGEWARESCRIVESPGFYPDRRVPDPYLALHSAIALRRLHLAGWRLAALLNELAMDR